MDPPTGADGPTGTRPCAGSFIAATVREMRWVMMVGIGLIGTVSATVAAWFVSHKRTREDAARAKALADHPNPPPNSHRTPYQLIPTAWSALSRRSRPRSRCSPGSRASCARPSSAWSISAGRRDPAADVERVAGRHPARAETAGSTARCAAKNFHISVLARGPRASLYEPLVEPPDHA